MINNELSHIEIPEGIDNSINKGIDSACTKLKHEKFKRRKIILGITAACIGLFLTFGYTNPALASKLPLVGGVFKNIETNIHAPNNYSDYATSVNEKVTNNGISITLSDILCDGEGLYVTYKVESEKPFKYTSWGDAPLTMNQLLTNEDYNKVSFSKDGLDNTGFAGLEGKFIDDYTFIGMERYYLKSLNTEIPDNFDFEVKLTSVGTGALKQDEKDQRLKGTWAFKVPVTVDESTNKKIDINYKDSKGLSIDSIIITPFTIVVNSTSPEHTHYHISVNDDKNRDLQFDGGKLFKDGNTLSYFDLPTKDSKSLRIVISNTILGKETTINRPDGGYDTSYENLGEEILLDKTISID